MNFVECLSSALQNKNKNKKKKEKKGKEKNLK